MRKINAFSTPIITFQNKELLPELKDYLFSLKVDGIDSNIAPLIKNNLKESKFNLFTHENKIIKETELFITSCLKRAINDLKNEDEDYDININESWFHIGKKNSSHDVHIHPNCSWCGVFYVQSGDRDCGGKTIFNNPIQSNFLDYATIIMREPAVIIQPEDGKLVLFPSYLNHYQSLYTGDEERIVVAFNSIILQKQN